MCASHSAVSGLGPCLRPVQRPSSWGEKPGKKPERDSRGHGYSWRDLVQRICNLHFKHTLKSVPGRQPRSALTLVAGGPRWCSDTFSFKTEHKHTHTNYTEDSRSVSFYSSPLTDPSPSPFSLRLCFYVLCECSELLCKVME